MRGERGTQHVVKSEPVTINPRIALLLIGVLVKALRTTPMMSSNASCLMGHKTKECEWSRDYY
jgi:hypothetical protein